MITSNKVRQNDVDTIWIVQTTLIFQPSKLRRKKYVETMWIFQPAKIHRKSALKWHGSSWRFGLRLIDVISTSNRHRLDVMCPLGIRNFP